MKKFLLLLLIAVMAIVGVSYATEPSITAKNDGVVVRMKNTAPLSSFVEHTPLSNNVVIPTFEPTPPPDEPEIEQCYHCDDIPLTYEEQDWLRTACEEFDIPYGLTLGLIEKETRVQNILGDDGASAGYMQIQQKWHWDRMERLGVTDLMEPSGNFRVGCDFLAELYARYNDWSVALTVYNRGHDPGYITDYAKEVMENYTRWQEIVKDYI